MTIARSDDVRRENQRLVLSVLRSRNPLSRTELKSETGLSAATVTAITSALLDNRYLVEASERGERDTGDAASQASRPGRPQVLLALNPKAATVGVIILTLNRISAAIVDYAGKVIVEAVEKVETQALERNDIIRKLAALLKKMAIRARLGASSLRQITVAVQGVSDVQGTRMQWSPITPHRDLMIADELQRIFGAPVTVMNDATMIAAALQAAEPKRYGESFAAILLSHGIGMGLCLNGKPFTGIRSSAAEFGHMCHIPDGALCRCGRHGCIEAYAGDYGIWRIANGADLQKVPPDDINPGMLAALVEKAKRGDENAIRAFHTAGVALGNGLRNMFALMDPFPVAFVGPGTLAFDLMEPVIRKSLGRRNVGLSYADAEIHCRTDDLDLTRDGSIVTALSAFDSAIQISRDQPAGEHRHAG